MQIGCADKGRGGGVGVGASPPEAPSPPVRDGRIVTEEIQTLKFDNLKIVSVTENRSQISSRPLATR